jgi:Ser/Thr protein kinase RdoA (MazF antagonist)
MLLEDRRVAKISEADAAALACELYSLEASAEVLPGEYDDNFQLATYDRRNFVLKIMHPARDWGFVDLQCRALEHLAQRAPELPLPRAVPGRNGELINRWKAPDGSARLVWCLGFIPGNLLAKVKPQTTELLRDFGRFLGRVDAALADFSHPDMHRELKWDLARASWIRGYLDQIEAGPRRRLVAKFLDLYATEVEPVSSRLRRSAVYGDANDYNVLVSDPWPQPRRIAGLIDFGDLHHTITISDLAIAAAYAILDKKARLSAAITRFCRLRNRKLRCSTRSSVCGWRSA